MKLINDPLKRTAEILKVTGHPTRIEIIRFLHAKKNGKISVKQIQEALGLTQVDASRHLIALKNLSVLECDKEGTNSFYSISNEVFVQNLIVCLTKTGPEKTIK